MKTGFFRSWKLVIILAALPVAVGILHGPSLTATAEETAPSNVPAAVPDTLPASQPTASAPAAVKLSPGATEVAKLAQAGLGEDVMLAYVGNVNSTFNLGSDQIVYLNDLGVSGTVVKAMIQRDAQYSADAQAWAAANQQTIAPPTTPASADDGSYPTPPADDSGAINPGDMADSANPGDYGTPDDAGYFYNSLAPYGSWIYVSGAGLCWQPTVYVGNRSWQPYFDRGRWVYSDCGWYWQSDYSWGWAAFHYGRWFNDGNHGWVWKPDRVWGPAWVSWRQSADYCGWAPLPPSARYVPGAGFQYRGHSVPANYDFGLRASQYTFIPVARLTDYSPYRYAASSSQAIALYSETAAINHVTFEHNHVVSHGINPEQVAMASGIEVRRAEIHETPVNPNTGILSDRMAKQGNSLMIFRPKLSSPSATGRPGQFYAPPARSPGTPKTSFNNAAPGSTAAPVAGTESYPQGSLVVFGARPGNASYQSRAMLPAPQTFNGYRQQFANRQDQTAAQFTPGESQVVIPSHFTVASRLEGHSAYSVYGATPRSEPAEQNHSPEWTGYAAPANHSASAESHSEHFAEHSASVSVSHSSSTSSSSSSSHH